MHIHILGPSGSGTSSLGRGLATRLGLAFLDSDDFFWEKTDPPYAAKTDGSVRSASLRNSLGQAGSWVLSGSCLGWGDFVRPLCDLIIWLQAPVEVRLERLVARETQRHGQRIAPGGDMWQLHQDFLAWAASYDKGGMNGRSHASEAAWLRQADCMIVEFALDMPEGRILDFMMVLAGGLMNDNSLQESGLSQG